MISGDERCLQGIDQVGKVLVAVQFLFDEGCPGFPSANMPIKLRDSTQDQLIGRS
jgi:hypothetical protein